MGLGWDGMGGGSDWCTCRTRCRLGTPPEKQIGWTWRSMRQNVVVDWALQDGGWALPIGPIAHLESIKYWRWRQRGCVIEWDSERGQRLWTTFQDSQSYKGVGIKGIRQEWDRGWSVQNQSRECRGWEWVRWVGGWVGGGLGRAGLGGMRRQGKGKGAVSASWVGSPVSQG